MTGVHRRRKWRPSTHVTYPIPGRALPFRPPRRASIETPRLHSQCCRIISICRKRISGDIVTAVNGQRINNFSDFQFAVRRYQPGETITLRVLRDGKTLDLRLTLVPRTAVRN